MIAELQVPIRREADIVAARQAGRSLAHDLGFSSTDQVLIATAISELARNIVNYAGEGEVLLRTEQKGARRGLGIVAEDHGPGIADIELAMKDGYSTAKSLGMGLPGAKRLMDEFEIDSKPGHGTTVRLKKWLDRVGRPLTDPRA